MKRLYQWFSERTSFFHSEGPSTGTSRTVRTEVTVQRERMTVLAGSAGGTGFAICPLCGNELAPPEADRRNSCPHESSISKASAPLAGPCP
jgi:hypothetical protein